MSGRRLAAAPRMVSAGGEGRRAVRGAQSPAGIPRGTGTAGSPAPLTAPSRSGTPMGAAARRGRGRRERC